MNLQVSSKYSEATRHAMSMLNEKELSLELIEALLKYIAGTVDASIRLSCVLSY